MADAEQIKKTVATVLGSVSTISSFVSSISPLFSIVSSVAGLASKALSDEEGHPLYKNFQAIYTDLKSINGKIQQAQRENLLHEVNETYSKYELYIILQFEAFSEMEAEVKKNPNEAQSLMDNFKKVYEERMSNTSLNTYYDGVLEGGVFKKTLLEMYLENCDGDREIMTLRCSHIAHLFHLGLITFMAYTVITKDDVDEVQKEWEGKIKVIHEKMQEVINRCKQPDKSPST